MAEEFRGFTNTEGLAPPTRYEIIDGLLRLITEGLSGADLTAYESRNAFFVDLGSLADYPDNAVVLAGTEYYRREASATLIPDLPGWIPAGNWTVEHFGAIGDGTTDDTAAIQAAVDASVSVGRGPEIFLGPKTYIISDTIWIKNWYVTLSGVNRDSTFIQTTFTDKAGIRISRDYGGSDLAERLRPDLKVNAIKGVILNDLSVRAESGLTATFGEAAIDVRLGGRVQLRECSGLGFCYGVAFRGCDAYCTLVGGAYAGPWEGTPNVAGSAGITIRRLECRSTTGSLDSVTEKYYLHTAQIHFVNTSVRALNTEYGLYVDSVDGLYTSNCYFGGNSVACVAFQPKQSNIPVMNVAMSGGMFDPEEGTEAALHLMAQTYGTPDTKANAQKLLFSNIVLGGSDGAGLVIAGGYSEVTCSNLTFNGYPLGAVVVNNFWQGLVLAGITSRAIGPAGSHLHIADGEHIVVANWTCAGQCLHGITTAGTIRNLLIDGFVLSGSDGTPFSWGHTVQGEFILSNPVVPSDADLTGQLTYNCGRSVTVMTDSAGKINQPHLLYSAPTFAIATCQSTSGIAAIVEGQTATDLVLKFRSIADGTAVADTELTFYWEAKVGRQSAGGGGGSGGSGVYDADDIEPTESRIWFTPALLAQLNALPGDADDIDETETRIWYTPDEQTKLAGIQAEAEKNLTGAPLIAAMDAALDDGGFWRTGEGAGSGGGGYGYPARSDFVTDHDVISATLTDGQTVNAGGFFYERRAGANVLPGLNDFIPAGAITPQHFGAVGDNVNDDTAAINAALAYAGAYNEAGRVANKKGSGGTVFLPVGTYRTTAQLEIRKHGVTLVGEGPTGSLIVPSHYNGRVIYIAGTDPTNADGSTNNKIDGVTIKSLGIWSAGGDLNRRIAIEIDRGWAELDDLNLTNQHQGVLFSATEKGCRFTRTYITHGSSEGYVAGSYAIAIYPREVAESDSQGKPSLGSWYDHCTSIYLETIQTNNVTGNGFDVVVDINATDGIYVSNCHFGMGKTAIIRFKGTHANQPILNGTFDMCFLDDDGGVNTEYSILVPSDNACNIVDIQFTGGEINAAKFAGVRLASSLLDGFTCIGTPFTNGKKDAAWVSAGNQIKFANCPVKALNASAVDGVAFRIDGGSDIEIEHCSCSEGAYNFARLTGTPTGVILHGNKIRDITGPDEIYSSIAPAQLRVSDNVSTASRQVTAATLLPVPLAKDLIIVNGNTQIDGILATAGAQNYAADARRVVLVFTGSPPIRNGQAGNNGLLLPGGTTINATPNTVLEFGYVPEVNKWGLIQ